MSPNYKETLGKRSEILNRVLPELRDMNQGELMENNDLKLVVQTGFYALPGTVKFRDFLFYDQTQFKETS